jgi:hypothetical protein
LINHKKYLYNPWTEVSHGHARSELSTAKIILSDKCSDVEIISFAKDFGDIHIDLPKRKIGNIPNILKRGPLFRFSVAQFQQDHDQQLLKFLRSTPTSLEQQLIITSARAENLKILYDEGINHMSIRARIIHPPEKTKLIGLLDFASNMKNTKIAVETFDGKEFLARLGITNIQVLPPIQGATPIKLNHHRDKVGVFWPVSFSESVSNLGRILDKVKQFNCLVRLPGNLDHKELRNRYPDYTFIERGISEEDFNRFIGDTRIAILPHREYKMRGSGLAAILAGCGIPILSYSSNSFFKDIQKYARIENLENFIDNDILLVRRIENEISNPSNSTQYRRWTIESWDQFLANE